MLQRAAPSSGTGDENTQYDLPTISGLSVQIPLGHYKPYGRLNVAIGDEDPLGSFVFRTTGFNSIRTLAARLHYFQAISGNRLACLPLELRLRGKSTRQSHGTPIFYADLTVRGSMDMSEALVSANELDSRRQATG